MAIEHDKNFFKNKVAFATGTGRCGTSFIARVVALEPEIASVQERNPLNETFHRYCKWNKLPVDNAGFLATKEKEIRRDLDHNRFSFESSAYLTFSIEDLYKHFGAKFILLVRSPEKVVGSYYFKGETKGITKWYETPYIKADPHLAPGYQEYTEFHHFFGRIAPLGEEFIQWNQLTRVGKLAWYWNAVNQSVFDQFQRLPRSHQQVEKLENLNYQRYREISQFLGFESQVSEESYQKLAASKPNAQPYTYLASAWTAQEVREFQVQVAPMAEQLKYKLNIDRTYAH